MKKIIQFKENEVNKIIDLIKSSKSFLIFEYQGIDAVDVTHLRKEMLKNDSKMIVVKNNILNRAIKKSGYEEFGDLVGPNAIAFGKLDAISPLRVLNEISKDNDFIKIKGSVIENKYLDSDKTIILSKLPTREVLYSMLLSCLTSPIRNFLYGLKSISEQKN